ncbi:MAG TPA: c-type cytochrome, partial [Pyrinomonadaceae bacterium]|nr:c-type cytochrome [Pyrinomonadaceae bacterium]
MKRFTQAVSIAALLCCLIGMNATPKAQPSQPKGDTASQSERDAPTLFAKSCSTCHGKDGRAKTFKAKFNKARNLTDAEWQASVSDERIFNSITNGRGKKMPAF